MNNPDASALALVNALARDLGQALALIREAQALAGHAPAHGADRPRSGREARARHKRHAAAAYAVGVDDERRRACAAALAEAERIVARVLG